MKPTSDRGGVLFSVTDVPQQIMYVGVKLSAVQGNHQNVILYYTEPGSERSYEAASFRVHSMRDTWTRFAIAVRDDKVMFYLNCDTDPQVSRIERSPDEMELDAGAGVFVGQAGGADPDKFLVRTQVFDSVLGFFRHQHENGMFLFLQMLTEQLVSGCVLLAW